MSAWILIVALANGQTIGSPFETKKQCEAALKDVKRELKGDKNVKSIECVEGAIEEEKKKTEEYI